MYGAKDMTPRILGPRSKRHFVPALLHILKSDSSHSSRCFIHNAEGLANLITAVGQIFTPHSHRVICIDGRVVTGERHGGIKMLDPAQSRDPRPVAEISTTMQTNDRLPKYSTMMR